MTDRVEEVGCRGIWVDHGMGPSGEYMITVIDSRRHTLVQSCIPHGMDYVEFCNALHSFLDTVDPVTGPRLDRPPTVRRLAGSSLRAAASQLQLER